MIRYFTAGESHGPTLTGIVEGVPAGLEITEDEIERHLIRRQKGYGRAAVWHSKKTGLQFNQVCVLEKQPVLLLL